MKINLIGTNGDDASLNDDGRFIIYPTNRCFDDALELLEDFAKHRPDIIHDLRLAHGITFSPDGTERWSHAWVEDVSEDTVLFVGLIGSENGERGQFFAPKDNYYAETGAHDVTLYTIEEALEQNALHETYGPWLKKYQDLCNTED